MQDREIEYGFKGFIFSTPVNKEGKATKLDNLLLMLTFRCLIQVEILSGEKKMHKSCEYELALG